MSARVAGFSLFLSLVLAAPVAAQIPTFVVTPIAGAYLPTANLMGNQTVDLAVTGPTEVRFKQEPGLALGLRASRTLSSKLAVEGEFVWVQGLIQIERTGVAPLERTLAARVLQLGATVSLELFRAPFTPFALYVAGGLGAISRGGTFYDEGGGLGFFSTLDSQMDIGLIGGLGVRYGLSPMFGLRLDVRDFVSSYAQPLPDGGTADSQLQNDLLVTAGLELSF